MVPYDSKLEWIGEAMLAMHFRQGGQYADIIQKNTPVPHVSRSSQTLGPSRIAIHPALRQPDHPEVGPPYLPAIGEC
jgi:hypothetical protein